MFRLKRAYAPAAPEDGKRILVERLWPRGMTRAAFKHDAWLKDVAPSPALRKWYAHDVSRWDEFQARYRAELAANPEAWQPLLDAGAGGTVTLLYGARDPDHNSALVLKEFLAARRGRARKPASPQWRAKARGR